MTVNTRTRTLAYRDRMKSLSYTARQLRMGFTAQRTADSHALVLTIQPPLAPSHDVDHVPCEIMLVIDVSGSMQIGAPPPDGGESTGLSILDLTKHAAKTIVASLNERDRLGLVTFSNEAKVVQGLTAMTPAAKEEMIKKIECLRCEQATNLWAGLRKGLKAFEGSADEVSRTRAMFVLTDGQPNHMCPAKGYIPALQPLLDQEIQDGRPPIQINSFGFGYAIRSGLLVSIAEMSGGTYGFIPDCGMIGTVFIHATANLFATYATNACLQLEFPAHHRIALLAGLKCHTEVRGPKRLLSIPLGSLLYGQPRDLVLAIDPAAIDDIELAATLQYFANNSRVTEILTGSDDHDDTFYPLSSELSLYNTTRAQMCNILIELFPEGADGERRSVQASALKDAIDQLGFLAEYVRQHPAQHHEGVQSLLSDLVGDQPAGQISLALSKTEYYDRWGKHYLPSILGAHQRQYCNSFKDAGPLQYGRDSALFTMARDRLNDIFDNMEVRSYASDVVASLGYGQQASAPVSMGSRFNNADVDCFAGICRVQMASGVQQALHSIRPGDIIQSQNGPREVMDILKKDVSDVDMAQLGELIITPWHPICPASVWAFPAELPHHSTRYTGPIYSLLLAPSEDPSQHTAIIEGVICTTLGHGILDKHASEDIRGHAFYGSYGKMQAYLCAMRKPDKCF